MRNLCLMLWGLFACGLDLKAQCTGVGSEGGFRSRVTIMNGGSSQVYDVSILQRILCTGNISGTVGNFGNMLVGESRTVRVDNFGGAAALFPQGNEFLVKWRDCSSGNDTWRTNTVGVVYGQETMGLGDQVFSKTISAITNCNTEVCWLARVSVQNLTAFNKQFAWTQSGLVLAGGLLVAGGSASSMEMTTFSDAQKAAFRLCPVNLSGVVDGNCHVPVWIACSNDVGGITSTFPYQGQITPPEYDPSETNGGQRLNLTNNVNQQGTNSFGTLTNYALETTLSVGLDGIFNAITAFAAKNNENLQNVEAAVVLGSGTNAMEVRAAGASVGQAVTNLMNSVSNRLGTVTNAIGSMNISLGNVFRTNIDGQTMVFTNTLDSLKVTIAGQLSTATNQLHALTNLQDINTNLAFVIQTNSERTWLEMTNQTTNITASVDNLTNYLAAMVVSNTVEVVVTNDSLTISLLTEIRDGVTNTAGTLGKIYGLLTNDPSEMLSNMLGQLEQSVSNMFGMLTNAEASEADGIEARNLGIEKMEPLTDGFGSLNVGGEVAVASGNRFELELAIPGLGTYNFDPMASAGVQEIAEWLKGFFLWIFRLVFVGFMVERFSYWLTNSTLVPQGTATHKQISGGGTAMVVGNGGSANFSLSTNAFVAQFMVSLIFVAIGGLIVSFEAIVSGYDLVPDITSHPFTGAGASVAIGKLLWLVNQFFPLGWILYYAFHKIWLQIFGQSLFIGCAFFIKRMTG